MSPAHSQPLPVHVCTEEGCTKPATRLVRNARNEPIRVCCETHAAQLVALLNREAKP